MESSLPLPADCRSNYLLFYVNYSYCNEKVKGKSFFFHVNEKREKKLAIVFYGEYYHLRNFMNL